MYIECLEALVLIGVLQWDFVGESEEKEVEGFSWNKIEVGCLDFSWPWLGLGGTLGGVSGCLHLFESVHDGGVELMFVGEMVLEVVVGHECFQTEGTAVASRKSAEEAMEVEVVECRGNVLTVLTMEEGKIALVHPNVVRRRR
jgi:hypothetical protein